jgi:Mce-associated membrane protein
LIASVQVVVTPVSGKAVTKRNRLRADLTRTADGWKLSSLGQVPMGGA